MRMKEDTRLRVLGTIETGVDLLLVNLLWAGCCIPIVTAGAATTALHYVTRKIITGEEYQIGRSFFHSFRENFKQATALWLLLMALIAVCVGDFIAAARLNGWLRVACLVISVLTGLVALALGTLAYPLLVRFRSSFSQMIKNALILAMSKPLVVLANAASMAVLPVLALLWKPFLAYALPVGLLIGGVLPAMVVERMLRPVLSRLEQSADQENIG